MHGGRQITVSLTAKRVSRVVLIIMTVLGLIGIFWAFNKQSEYQRTLPRREDLASGRIYPLNVHGIVVWQTRAEDARRKEVEYVSAGILFTAILLWQMFKKTLRVRRG